MNRLKKFIIIWTCLSVYFIVTTLIFMYTNDIRHHKGNITEPLSTMRYEVQPILQVQRNKTLTIDYEGGRLGNSMFETASAIGIAESNGKSFQFICNNPHAATMMSVFPKLTSIGCTSNLGSFKHVQLSQWGKCDPYAFQLESQDDIMLHGYLQSHKYFRNYSDSIRNLFEFSSSIQSKAMELLKDVKGNVTVGVHVRRGDYLKPVNIDLGYILPQSSYFETAMSYFRHHVIHPLFIVVSEDLEWCINNLNAPDVVYKSTNSPEVDMCLLSMTDHVIISVGTYSWWSGFLNRGIVKYFRNIAKNGSEYSNGFNADDFFPPEWIE